MTQRTNPALLTGLTTATRGQLQGFTGSDITVSGGQGFLTSLLESLHGLPDELRFRAHDSHQAAWLDESQVTELTDLYHSGWFKRTQLPR